MSSRLRRVPLGGRPRRAFIDAVLAGESAWFDIDDWVEEWHRSDTDLELHKWLGLTFDEYAVLGAGDNNLAVILYSRRHSVPLAEAVAWFEREPVAARGDGDPEKLQQLLVREGLVEA